MDLNKDTASPRKMKRGRTDADVVLVVRGTVIDAPELGTLRVLEKAVLGVDASGRVAFCEDGHDEELAVGDKLTLRDGGVFELPAGCTIRSLPPRGFLCPGFVDTHTHAPQFSFAGVGYDLQLLDWLNKYTFPSEAKFEDPTFAARVCRNAVARTLHHGTTTALYFATIHTDAALQLGRIASGLGQRAFVGKVNMDRNAPDFYCESTSESLAETERFVSSMLHAAASSDPSAVSVVDGGKCIDCAPLGPPALPVITPRFVPTCSTELMTKLGQLAARHGLRITSHVSESPGEISWVQSLHPEHKSYTDCYDSPGLLTPRTILAHGVYLNYEERSLMARRGTTLAHCPLSNSMLRSGMLNVRRCLDEGVPIALGTDVCGGASPSMLSAVREALKVSNLVSLGETRADGTTYAPLTFYEAFHIATVSGARAMGVAHLTGHFRPGSLLDALIIDPEAGSGPGSSTMPPFDLYEGDTPREAFEKWLMLGDERNTAAVYVCGRCVHPHP